MKVCELVVDLVDLSWHVEINLAGTRKVCGHFWLAPSWNPRWRLFYHIMTSTIRMLDPKNMGIDTEIMPLSYPEPEIMSKTCSEWRPFWNPRWRPTTQIPAWQTTCHDSGDPKEYFDTTCQLLPKMFSRTSILNFCHLTRLGWLRSRLSWIFRPFRQSFLLSPMDRPQSAPMI